MKAAKEFVLNVLWGAPILALVLLGFWLLLVAPARLIFPLWITGCAVGLCWCFGSAVRASIRLRALLNKERG